jgi:hypothetical protein
MNLPPNMLSPWPVEDEHNPSKIGVYVNYYGFKQLTDGAGDDVCIACDLPYTNKGDGMLCGYCRNLLRNHMGEFE